MRWRPTPKPTPPGVLPADPERGPVTPAIAARRRRRRIIEDLPENLTVEAVEYQIPRHWCSCCKKHVEPKVSATLPGAAIGHRLAAMTTVFHYGLGLVIDQTRQILGSPLRTNVSAGGLVSLGRRMAEVLLPWYEQIAQKARGSATLHADETGWRVNGQTHWLWRFCNHESTYYLIDRSRGSPALKRFFTEAFRGVLIHDFWRPYESVLLEGEGDHQCCLAHLLRELDHVDEQALPRKTPAQAACWRGFVKRLRRLLRDGLRPRRRRNLPATALTRCTRVKSYLHSTSMALFGAHARPDRHRRPGGEIKATANRIPPPGMTLRGSTEIVKRAGWRYANIVACGPRECVQPLMILSDLQSTRCSCQRCRRRMRQKPSSRDETSQGLAGKWSRIREPARAERPLLLISASAMM